MIKEKRFVFEITAKNLVIGLSAAVIALAGLFLYISVISGRVSFAGSPYPRQDRAFFLFLAWGLIACPFLILAPNKTGVTAAFGVVIALYISLASTMGSWIVFAATEDQFYMITLGIKQLVAPIWICIVLVYLLYHGVSGQEFFKALIFSFAVIGILILSVRMELI